jgi:digeranylgeranylglycerophospholipid reductase
MKYDLIVVGGGPGGLMAAKVAAEDGLKVILVESKKNITEINRACVAIFYTCKMSPSGATDTGIAPHVDGYIKPVSVECLYDLNKTRFHFYEPDFHIDYEGCLRPYLDWVQISPSGHQVHRFETNHWPWGFYFDKEAFVAGLLAEAEKAGVEIWTETIGLGAENVENGVKVRVKGKSGEQTLEGRAAIAADGRTSKIVESLGLNKDRPMRSMTNASYVGYIMEGVETNLPYNSWLSFTLPSINPFGTIMIGMWKNNMNTVGALGSGKVTPESILKKFMEDPKYAPWFHKAKLVKKEGVGISGIADPLKDCVFGNVVCVGDAGLGEAWVQGAVAQAYQAVKAIEKELNGQKGYPEYIKWRQNAFAIFTPNYWNVLQKVAYTWMKHVTDDDVDYVYKLFQGKIGYPPVMIAKNLNLIRKGRPELYKKLTESGVLPEV